MTFGTKLRKHREIARLSQQEVADAIGVSQSTYNLWESDKSRFRVDYLPKLAEVYGVDIGELIPENTSVKIVNNRDNKDSSINGFEIKVEARELYQEIIASKNEVIAAKDETIRLLEAKILILEATLSQRIS
jgi:transcriptional regulator with XRE-family HTH domain